MGELMANLKKDFLGVMRSKKLYAYIFIPIGLLLFSIFTVLLLNALAGSMEEVDQFAVKEVYILQYFFNTMMNSYYVLPMIFMLMGAVSKEMKQKKWLLPICNGMDNRKMILSKVIINSLIPTAFAFIGGMLSIACGAIFFENQVGLTFWDMFLPVLTMSVNVLFYAVMTISLSALSKRYLISAGIPVVLIMIGSAIISAFGALEYTPFLFAQYQTGMEIEWWKWLIASFGVIIVDGALLLGSMFKKQVVYM